MQERAEVTYVTLQGKAVKGAASVQKKNKREVFLEMYRQQGNAKAEARGDENTRTKATDSRSSTARRGPAGESSGIVTDDSS
ncbi:hypothetical protein E2C01_094066 [Portunus trituberculatus]|uniref:Uncharacterized protein n=1 Tax=Portunus trituberculatus TaxID=210409 RepID=A0A5B7JWM5_PORTR|nr:hypothetical protein [Portunus trituberculatus]